MPDYGSRTAARGWYLSTLLAANLLLCLFSHAATAAGEVILQLRWDHQFQFAGYYAAEWQGYYDEAGLDVEIRSGLISATTAVSAIDEVAAGRADFGIGAADILHARAHGAPLVLLASFFQHSPIEFYSLEEVRLDSPADLARLRVARIPDDLHDMELQALLRMEGIDPSRIMSVHLERRGAERLEVLLENRADVVSAYSFNLPYRAEQAGIAINTLRPESYGIDFYGDSLFTREGLIERNPKLVEAFTQASIRGWVYALEHPEELAQRIVEEFEPFHEAVDFLDYNLYQAGAVSRLMMHPFVEPGNINPRRWERMSEYMADGGIIPVPLPAESFIYDPAHRRQAEWERLLFLLSASLLILLLLAVLAWIVFMRRALAARTRELRNLNHELEERVDARTRELREAHHRLQGIIEGSRDPIGAVDSQYHFIAFNSAFQEEFRSIFGVDLKVGDSVVEVLSHLPQEQQAVTEMWSRALTGEEFSVVQAFGDPNLQRNVYEITYSRITDDRGEQIGAAQIARDITTRVRAQERLEDLNKELEKRVEDRTWELARANEELRQENREREETESALRESEERYRLIGESIDFGIWIANAEGHCTYASPAFLELVGRSLQEVQEFGWMDCLPPEDVKPTMQKWLRCVETGEDWDHEHRFRATNGQEATVLSRGKPVRDSHGHIISWVGINLDITERKQMEEALRDITGTLEQRVAGRTRKLEQQAAQLRLLAQQLTEAEQRERRRLAELLHDHLQQLLVAAKMRIDGARRNAEDRVKQALEESSGLLNEAIQESRSLTAELRPPVLYEGGLGSALKWLSEKMGDQYELYVHLHVEEKAEPRRDYVKAMLYEAARELLFNVVKYADVEQAHVSLELEDGVVCLTVRDEGKGFDLEEMEQRDHRTGRFGLFSIRERLKVLGGRIDVESRPGQGSEFRIFVPLEGEQEEESLEVTSGPEVSVGESMASLEEQAVPDNRIRVLIADDHQIVREGIANLLEDEFDISVVGQAKDGEEVLVLARALHPDVVVMDVNMPRVNGIEATRNIRRELPSTCIIGLSVQEEDATARAMMSAGAAAYVSKGEAHESLIRTIRNCMLPEPN